MPCARRLPASRLPEECAPAQSLPDPAGLFRSVGTGTGALSRESGPDGPMPASRRAGFYDRLCVVRQDDRIEGVRLRIARRMHARESAGRNRVLSELPGLRSRGGAAVRRNLLMHIYPLRCHQNWRRSVAHLCARWDQFTGRRVASVALDEKTNSLDEVREAFGNREVEFRAVKNGPLQEVASFPGLLETVEPDRDSITFYCHAKGATHCDPTSASHLWCDAMAEACLDYPELVDCCLSEAVVCGAFRSKMIIGWPGPSPPFHFAGTWFWFRNDVLFERDWRQVDPVLWGVEAWPGFRFAEAESRCLFLDNAHTLHLYDQAFWAKIITPGMVNWRSALERCGLVPKRDYSVKIPSPLFAVRPSLHPLAT